MAQSIEIPVRLGLQEALSQANQLRQVLQKNVNPNTRGYNDILSIIEKIERAADGLQGKLGSAFKTSRGATSFVKEYEKLLGMFDVAKSRFANLGLGEIKFQGADADKVKDITKNLTELETRISNIQKNKVSGKILNMDEFKETKNLLDQLKIDPSNFTIKDLTTEINSQIEETKGKIGELSKEFQTVENVTAKISGGQLSGLSGALEKALTKSKSIDLQFVDPKQINDVTTQLTQLYRTMDDIQLTPTLIGQGQSVSDYLTQETGKIRAAYDQQIQVIQEQYNKLNSIYGQMDQAKTFASKKELVNDQNFQEVAKQFNINIDDLLVLKGNDFSAKFQEIRKQLKESIESELNNLLNDKTSFEGARNNFIEAVTKIFDTQNIGERLITNVDKFKSTLQSMFKGTNFSIDDFIGDIKNGDNAQSVIDNIINKIHEMQAAGEQTINSEEYNKLSEVLGILEQALTGVSNADQAEKGHLDDLRASTQSYTEDLEKLISAALKMTGIDLSNILNPSKIEEGQDQIQNYIASLDSLERKQKALSNVQGAVSRWMGFYQVLNLAKRAVNDMKQHITELDSVMTKIAVVTNMSQDDLWGQIGQYSEIARQYGVAIKGVYEVSQIFYQQGLDKSSTMELTTETLKMARIAGIDYGTAADYMTTAIRGFKLEMTDAAHVTDVFSNLAAHTASSTEELATAISKTAASAEAVGSSFEATSAMISTMVSVTRESATNIGTALKSVISRYGEMTSDPSKLMDAEGEEMSLNRVDKALQTIGISIHTAAGQFRDFDDVILELGEKWDTLDSTSQRYIATLMAGNRQQSRFLALVSNIDEYKKALDLAMNSEDTGELQTLKTLDSVDAKLERMKVTIQEFYTSSGLQDLYKNLLDTITNVVSAANSLPKAFGKIPATALAIGSQIITIVKNLLKLLIVNVQQTIEALKNGQLGFSNIFSGLSDKAAIEGENSGRKFADGFNNGSKGIGMSLTSRIATVVSSALATVGAGMTLDALNKYGASKDVTGKTDKEAGTETLLGGIASGIGSGLTSALLTPGGPITKTISGLFSAAMSIIPAIASAQNMWNISDARKLELATKNAEEEKQKQLENTGTAKELQTAYEKLSNLKQNANESAEAMDEYQQYMSQLADSYPSLVHEMDAAGNKIIELSDLETALANARIEAANSTVAALKAERDRIKEEQRQYTVLSEVEDSEVFGSAKKALINANKSGNVTTQLDRLITWRNWQSEPINKNILHDYGIDTMDSDSFFSKFDQVTNLNDLVDLIIAGKDADILNEYDNLQRALDKIYQSDYIDTVAEAWSTTTEFLHDSRDYIKTIISNFYEGHNDINLKETFGIEDLSELDTADPNKLNQVIAKVREYGGLFTEYYSTLVDNIEESINTEQIEQQVRLYQANHHQTGQLSSFSSLFSYILSGILPEKFNPDDEDQLKVMHQHLEGLSSWALQYEDDAKWLMNELNYDNFRKKTGLTEVLTQRHLTNTDEQKVFQEAYDKRVQEVVGAYDLAVIEYLGTGSWGAKFTNLTKNNNNIALMKIQSALPEYDHLIKQGYTLQAEAYLNGLYQVFNNLSNMDDDVLYDTALASLKSIDFTSRDSISGIIDTLKTIEGMEQLVNLLTNVLNTIPQNIGIQLQQMMSEAQEMTENAQKVLNNAGKGLDLSAALKEADSILNKMSDKDKEKFKVETPNDLIEFNKELGQWELTSNAITIGFNQLVEEQQTKIIDLSHSLAGWNQLKHSLSAQASTATYSNFIEGYDISDKELTAFNTKLQEWRLDWEKDHAGKDWEQYRTDMINNWIANGEATIQSLQSLPQDIAKSYISKIDYAVIAGGTADKQSIKNQLSAYLQALGHTNFNIDKIYTALLQANFKQLEDLGLKDLITPKMRDDALKANIQQYQTAITELLNGAIPALSAETEGALQEIGQNSNDVIAAAKAFLDQLANQIGKAGLTISAYNDSAAEVLEHTLNQSKLNSGKILIDFASEAITGDTIKELATSYGKKLTDIVDVTTGVFKDELLGSQLQFNAVTGAYDIQGSFDEFILALSSAFNTTIERGTKQYADALAAFNSSIKSDIDFSIKGETKSKALLDFASSDITVDAIESFANAFGKDLSTIIDKNGAIQGVLQNKLSFNKLTGNFDIVGSFEEFVRALEAGYNIQVERTSKEYLDALSSYNDAQIKKKSELQTNLYNEIDAIAKAKPGDTLNLANITQQLGDDVANVLKQYGKETADGLLQIDNTINIPELISKITAVAGEQKKLLPQQINQLQDTVASLLNDTISLISNGAAGKLSRTQASELQNWAAAQGENINLDFSDTAEGLELTENSMFKLYNTIRKIDAMSAKKLLPNIKDMSSEYADLISATKAYRNALEEEDKKQALSDLIGSMMKDPSNFNIMGYKMPTDWEFVSEYASSYAAGQKAIETASTKQQMPLNEFASLVQFIGSREETADFTFGGRTAAEWMEDAMDFFSYDAQGNPVIDFKKADMTGKGWKEFSEALKLAGTSFREAKAEQQRIAKELNIAQEKIDFSKLFVGTEFSSEQLSQMLRNSDELTAAFDKVSVNGQKLGQLIRAGKESLQKALGGDYENILRTIVANFKDGTYTAENFEEKLSGLLGQYSDMAKITIGEDGQVEFNFDPNTYTPIFKIGDKEVDVRTFTEWSAAAAEESAIADGTTLHFQAGGVDVEVTLNEGKILFTASIENGPTLTANSMEGIKAGIIAFTDEQVNGSDEEISSPDTEGITFTVTYGEISVEVKFKDGKFEYDNNQPGLDEEAKEKINKALSNEKAIQISLSDENATVVQVEDEKYVIESSTGTIEITESELTDLNDNLEKQIREKIKPAIQTKVDEESEESIVNTPVNGEITDLNIVLSEDANVTFEGESIVIDQPLSAQGPLTFTPTTVSIDNPSVELADQVEATGKAAILNVSVEKGADIYFDNNDVVDVKDVGPVNGTTNLVQVSLDGESNGELVDNSVINIKEPFVALGQASKLEVDLALADTTIKQGGEGGEESDPLLLGSIGATTGDADSLEVSIGEDTTKTLSEGSVVSLTNPVNTLATASHVEVDIDSSATNIEPKLKEGTDPRDIGTIGNASAVVTNLTITEADNVEVPEELNGETTLTAKVKNNASAILEKIKRDVNNLPKDAEVDIGASETVTDVISQIEEKLDELTKEEHVVKITSEGSLPTDGSGGHGGGQGAVLSANNKAKGDVALAQGTLMGELGPELWVAGGHYYVAGQNGAEFVNLPKDAIVFNHLQTQRLLGTGRAGRGKPVTNEETAVAMAHGKAMAAVDFDTKTDDRFIKALEENTDATEEANKVVDAIEENSREQSENTEQYKENGELYRGINLNQPKGYTPGENTIASDVWQRQYANYQDALSYITKALESGILDLNEQKKNNDLEENDLTVLLTQLTDLKDNALTNTDLGILYHPKWVEEIEKAYDDATKKLTQHYDKLGKKLDDTGKKLNTLSDTIQDDIDDRHTDDGKSEGNGLNLTSGFRRKILKTTSVTEGNELANRNSKGNANGNVNTPGNTLVPMDAKIEEEFERYNSSNTSGEEADKTKSEFKKALKTLLSNASSKGAETINLSDDAYKGLRDEHFQDSYKKIRDAFSKDNVDVMGLIQDFGFGVAESVTEYNSWMMDAKKRQQEMEGTSESVRQMMQDSTFFDQDTIGMSPDTLLSILGNSEKIDDIIKNSKFDETLQQWIINRKQLEEAGIYVEDAANSASIIADSAGEIFKSIQEHFNNAIEGTLSHLDRDVFLDNLEKKGINTDNLKFEETAEGLILSKNSVIELYESLSKIDALQASLTFSQLKENLKETNKDYKDTAHMISHIGTLENNIADTQNKLNKAIQDNNDKLIAKYQKRLETQQAELEVAKQIRAEVIATEDEIYSLIDKGFQEGEKNPGNARSSYIKAASLMAKGKASASETFGTLSQINAGIAAGAETQTIAGVTLDGSPESLNKLEKVLNSKKYKNARSIDKETGEKYYDWNKIGLNNTSLLTASLTAQKQEAIATLEKETIPAAVVKQATKSLELKPLKAKDIVKDGAFTKSFKGVASKIYNNAKNDKELKNALKTLMVGEGENQQSLYQVVKDAINNKGTALTGEEIEKIMTLIENSSGDVEKLNTQIAEWTSVSSSDVTDAFDDLSNQTSAYIGEIERWYNYLQKIAGIETALTTEEKKRAALMSDINQTHGAEYIASLQKSYELEVEREKVETRHLRKAQEVTDKEIASAKKAGIDIDEIFAIDRERGTVSYKHQDFADSLEKIFGSSDFTGKYKLRGASSTATEQMSMLRDLFGESTIAAWTKYDENENRMEQGANESDEEFAKRQAELIYNRFQSTTNALKDDVTEEAKTQQNIYDAQKAANDILKEQQEIQIEAENTILKAVEDMKQQQIDDAKDIRDAYKEQSEKYINSLKDSLTREKEMYSNAKDSRDLTKLQNRLAILQRSGGSAAEISSLASQIEDKQQDIYFSQQEEQIDMLQESIDNEIERLDRQIEIMEESYEFEKENGLLWKTVEEILAQGPEYALAYIKEHDKDFKGISELEEKEKLVAFGNLLEKYWGIKNPFAEAGGEGSSDNDNTSNKKKKNGEIETESGGEQTNPEGDNKEKETPTTEESLNNIVTSWKESLLKQLESIQNAITPAETDTTSLNNVSDKLEQILTALNTSPGLTLDQVDVNLVVKETLDNSTIAKVVGQVKNELMRMAEPYNRVGGKKNG